MYLSKKWAILAISILVIIFVSINTEIKSQDIQITDGDTIKINGEKIRFSGIDTPELKQDCIKENIKNSYEFFIFSFIQSCFNSGVSMPLNLIFSPFILIVSPSVI